MSEERVCALCETVNVGDAELCIACGATFVASVSGLSTELATSAAASEAESDLDSAAHQQTMIESAAGGGNVPAVAVAAPPESSPESPSGAPPESTDAKASALPTMARFLARVLLPDGDRRSVEIGDDRVTLGSALHALGVTGDPRAAPEEGWLSVEDGVLSVEPADGAHGIYRRLRGEETLRDGDVVLMGDIAARFATLPAAVPVDEGHHVLGGGANSPIGRLVFLRRDGSDGPVHDIPAGKTVIGRTDGHLNFPTDGRLSRRHARFFASERGVALEDLGSRNGTYLRIVRREPLEIGDALRIGSAGLQVRSLA